MKEKESCGCKEIELFSGNILEFIKKSITYSCSNSYESTYSTIQKLLIDKYKNEDKINSSINYLLDKNLIKIIVKEDIKKNKYSFIKLTMEGNDVVRLRSS
jgi:hypothetical protein